MFLDEGIEQGTRVLIWFYVSNHDHSLWHKLRLIQHRSGTLIVKYKAGGSAAFKKAFPELCPPARP